MPKRCPNCKSEITRYQEFCYQCGAPIRHVAKRPKVDLGVEWKWFIVGFLLPPLGYAWFFFFSRNHYDAALSAFKGAIAASILSFLVYQMLSLVSCLGLADPTTTGVLPVARSVFRA
ncbi:MAG: zinc ribbon domain-containing protein [Candidatus Izemoplasmatales bacterium]